MPIENLDFRIYVPLPLQCQHGKRAPDLCTLPGSQPFPDHCCKSGKDNLLDPQRAHRWGLIAWCDLPSHLAWHLRLCVNSLHGRKCIAGRGYWKRAHLRTCTAHMEQRHVRWDVQGHASSSNIHHMHSRRHHRALLGGYKNPALTRTAACFPRPRTAQLQGHPGRRVSQHRAPAPPC